MLARYLKAQATVLLFGGLVGPIFLIVYFALGSMARPSLQWMFWIGLFVTAADVLAALGLASAGAKSVVRHDTVSQRLRELQNLRASGAVTDAEYNAKRQQILDDL